MSIRFAILTAVSSKAQAADDKMSLEIQDMRCRELGAARGWEETCGPYVIPGESRTRFVDLSVAEIAMPALKEMLDAAQAHKFDVLILYDYNRLRSLLGVVADTLRFYKVQIFSYSQQVEPVHPSVYNPYRADTAIQMESMNEMVSDLQIADLRRKYAENMPGRITERGLPVQIPYAYIKAPNSKTPPTLDVKLGAYVVEMKDLFLSGQSTRQIAAYMETTGIRPKGKRWYPETIRQILTNPFYAGVVRWGVTKSEPDLRSQRKHRNRKADPSRIVSGPGKHEPLWDMKTHNAIMAEFRRRHRTYRGKMTQTLSGLLSCGICGQRLWTFYSHVVGPASMIWRCSSRQDHVAIRNPDAMSKLTTAMTNDLMQAIAHPETKPEDTAVEALKMELQDLRDQLRRVNEAYKAGVYTLQEMAQNKTGLDDKILDLETTLSEHFDGQEDEQARAIVLEHIKNNLPVIGALLAGVPQDVNYMLRKILSDIVVTEAGCLELAWK